MKLFFRRAAYLLSFSYFCFSDVFASEPSKIFERLTDTQVKGDLLDFLLFTDFALIAEAEVKKVEADKEVAEADLKHKSDIYDIYKRLRENNAVSKEDFEDKELEYRTSQAVLEATEARLKEVIAYANVTNLRATWIKGGVPDDVEILRTHYLNLWKARCEHRASNMQVETHEVEYARFAYFRAERLLNHQAISKEDYINLNLRLRSHEGYLKTAIYLHEECVSSLGIVGNKV
jgi:hypothetical protein